MALPRRRNKLTLFLEAAIFLAVALFAANPARADWRDGIGTFRIGIVLPPDGAFARARLDEFRELLSEVLAMPVEIFPARDGSALIDAVATSRVEYAVFSALAYATASKLCECVEPLVAPVNREGANAVRSVLVADGAKVARIGDLAGLPVAIGPRDSLGGDLLPAAGFRWQGRPLARSGLDLRRVEITQEALRMLADGEVAAAFVWEFVRPGSAAVFAGGPRAYLEELAPDRFAVLWRSEPVRFGPHAVRRNLPSEAKAALRRALAGLGRDHPDVLDGISPELGGGFEIVTADEYRSALALVAAISASGE